MNDLMGPYEKELLQKARDTYSNKNQILVCMEELNELACVLAKFPRYENEVEATEKLHDKILDEVADVLIILDHVQNIVGLSDLEIRVRIEAKLERLKRWLEHSDSMQETIDDRKVKDIPEPCNSCLRKVTDEFQYETYCKLCMQAQATEGTYPYYIKNQENR